MMVKTKLCKRLAGLIGGALCVEGDMPLYIRGQSWEPHISQCRRFESGQRHRLSSMAALGSGGKVMESETQTLAAVVCVI